MGSTDNDLAHLLADLEALGRDAHGPPDDAHASRSLALMERAATFPGGLAALADRFGASDRALLTRPLTFLLAREAPHPHAAGASDPGVGALVLRVLSALKADDDTTRINLAGALHLLALRDALPDKSAPPDVLAAYLEGCLGRGPRVQEAVIPAVTALVAAGVRLDAAALGRLRERLAARGHADDLTRRALEAIDARAKEH